MPVNRDRNFMEHEIAIRGEVVTGLGKGRIFLSMEHYRRQFADALGFDPYPGTLNVKVEGEDLISFENLKREEGLRIEGGTVNGKRYGGAVAYRCKVIGIAAAIVVPEMSSHKDVVEVISGCGLRKSLKLRDGSILRITASL